jgi:hypothetical protein
MNIPILSALLRIVNSSNVDDALRAMAREQIAEIMEHA